MTSTIKDKVHDVGLTEVYSPSDPQVDVVLVHGLNGHPYNTWATHKPEVFWPADLLPDVVKEQGCRILTYGYNANVTAFTDGASKDHIHNHAEHLAARLVANRSIKARERPIIFVVHSLGGLVVKRLLIYCESINNPKLERLRSIYVSTFGILFLGTPHNGSDLAKWGTTLQSICAAVLPKKLFDSSPSLVNALKSNNETLQNINRLFIEIMEPFRIYFFHEQKPMDLKGTRQFVVEEESAAPLLQGVERMGIEKDHSTMCKFEDTDAPGFDVVADAISSYAEEAPLKIRIRWEREKRVREYYRQSMASELLGDPILGPGQYEPQPTNDFAHRDHAAPIAVPGHRPLLEDASPTASFVVEEADSSVHSSRLLEQSTSQHSQKQPRVAPLLFRPNSIFVGFDIELDQLKHKLSSEKKSKLGTCSVLICGPPGSGKSHLARQYVWTNQSEYPAGIFWVDCKSKQNVDRYYWDIGQALGCLESHPAGPVPSDRSFVQEVRKRLESLQGWLIVFDGVFFDSDEALSEFVQYLPDSPGNSIIYTSVDPTLKNRHRLLNPSWIRMRPLSMRAAQELLFKSLGIRRYNSTQLRKAQELVRYYRCLPLGIHAAAHMLIAQGRALEKFSPMASDKRLANPFLEIIRALEDGPYGAAMNLLVLLAFLNHKVPVVLLHFGAKALTDLQHDIESFDQTGGVKKALDNTIAVLLRYGLVERELQTCSVSSPGQSKVSPRISRTTTAASVDYSSPTAPSLPDEGSDLKLITTVNIDGDVSPKSVSISIDTLRTHTITQTIVREELRARDLQGASYNQWLKVAAQFLVSSYRTAAAKLGVLRGQGSIADYREYKTHIATLWKLLPRSSRDTSTEFSSIRESLRAVFREIQDEIRSRSPSQSQSSNDRQTKFIGSVFETSGGSSDEGPQTPTSNLTRASTVSLEMSDTKSESPTQYHTAYQSHPGEDMPELDDGYQTELDDLTPTLGRSQQWNPRSSTTSNGLEQPDNNRSQALLHTILYGTNDVKSGRRKDLGEFKPRPTVGRISSPIIEPIRPRSTSQSSLTFPWPFRRTSTGTSAKAALTAVQARNSPPRGYSLENRKASAGSEGIGRPEIGTLREPLAELSANAQVPLITADGSPVPVTEKRTSETDLSRLSRQESTSPRLVNAVLARQAAKAWDELPIEENILITRRYPLHTAAQAPIARNSSSDTLAFSPSGYMSVPMSRDASKESNFSVGLAPVQTLQGPSSFNTEYLHSHLNQTDNLPTIDVAMAQSFNFGNHGADWTSNSPLGINDDLPDLDLSREQTRIKSISAPTSAPMSPNPELHPHDTNGSVEILQIDPKGKVKADT